MSDIMILLSINNVINANHNVLHVVWLNHVHHVIPHYLEYYLMAIVFVNKIIMLIHNNSVRVVIHHLELSNNNVNIKIVLMVYGLGGSNVMMLIHKQEMVVPIATLMMDSYVIIYSWHHQYAINVQIIAVIAHSMTLNQIWYVYNVNQDIFYSRVIVLNVLINALIVISPLIIVYHADS